MRRVIIVLFFCMLLSFLGLAGTGLYAYLWYHTQTDAPEQAMIVQIPPGTGFNGIVSRLEEAELMPYPFFYKVMVALEGTQGQFKAGEYAIGRNAAPHDITQQLVSGQSIIHSLTFPEGKNTAEILTIIAADERLVGDLPSVQEVGEGTLMPDTYHFHRGDTKRSVVQKMQETQQQFVESVWPKRQEELPIHTPEEAIILASVVEKETGVDGERGKVASVFTNRLNIGMPLQSDPTVVYGIELAQGKPMERSLTRKDLQADTPHNSYTRRGLPPTPIANPGRDAIRAVLNPRQTDYLYFVATGTGGHYFSKNLAEHNRNVARYKAALRRAR